ncbi:hypothetical protein M4951_05335 [Blastopirellula sp. J2-11]|uniref:hypothetical protein n=1 Tax=Blastopirellula sp. J2-11 TaxID=2943192 RepID=UPI0021C824F0|nr:hypothetical protein [Blastopirellula sp. J2-11]UUO07732.1 hypothetical protein M4951_05335 [Blastopirellula sp. J2-11]
MIANQFLWTIFERSRGRLLVCGLMVFAGCAAPSDIDRIPVSGMVTVDGQPLDHGTIQFFPQGDTKGPMSGGRIANGRYQLDAITGPPPGQHLVRIAGKRKTGRMVQVPPDEYAPQGSVVEEMVDAVPERYNAKSELIHDVVAPSTELNFELKSK